MSMNDTPKRTAIEPIIPLLRSQAFDPETVEAMGKALVTACEALGLSDRDDAMTRLVAEKIIELAQRGMKNPIALHFAAMKEFRSDPQWQDTAERIEAPGVSAAHAKHAHKRVGNSAAAVRKQTRNVD
jgi:hypothetical protein